ncbi:MAG TPA: ribonuclease R [Maribacter sp.]|uniref:ribonuclease R n=1 Tax=Maribacter TaxID=252356 RepID=UPI000EC84857|nr:MULTISPECIES: ribonuclease R [Maribacter]CAG2534694.1 RNAse R [Maribacter dokdonensis]HAF78051.1 ribonuclease R [Maribacter sp.]|tara:strand:- start:51212 stop:53404 length:2193 start_codon:yes stop_codon:yes gene_type:complete
MSKRNKKAKNHRKNEITKGIFTVLEKEPNKSFNYKQIAAKINITDAQDRNTLIKRLTQLKEKKRIQEVDRGQFKVLENTKTYYEGTVDLTGKGHAYIVVDGMDDDVFIPSNKLNKAFHKDKVEVFIYPRKKSKKLEGEVVRVLERYKTTFVGIVDMQKTFAFVRPTDFRMYTDIFVSKDKLADAKDGEKVLVEITDWPDDVDSPFGRISQVLGVPGEHDTEIHSILAEYGLPYSFPEDVQKFADGLDTSIKEEEIRKRKDLRNVLTFTIDPKDAKDFDDALSFQKLENGNYEIGIHIADVSHYLQKDTILDDEAYERATSVYLVDRVVPMLPEVLSNNACSLRPNEEKYTFSAIFELDENATIRNQWFGRTVIDSNERFAYEEAQHIIETGSGEIPEEISIRETAYKVSDEVVEATLKMDELAKIMRDKRMDQGALSFDKVEVRFNLDENNEPVGVYFKESKDANKLIEEFMLLANRKVAEFIGKQKPKKTFVYRIHDDPDPDKLMALNGIVSRFGHKLDFKDKKTISSSLNKLLEDVKGKREQNMVDTLTIRSMSKAIYTIDNIGHYGLAFDYYTHFTSPIRRYPDVMVHRLLQHYLDGGKSANAEEFEKKCKHSSDMEYLASSAERDSIKYMQIKFMQDHKDEEFRGVISGVTEWGIYVEIISNKCEGMIRIRDIKGDYFIFDEREYAIIGERTKKKYTLGDEVTVMVKNTDLIKRHLDFALIAEDTK